MVYDSLVKHIMVALSLLLKKSAAALSGDTCSIVAHVLGNNYYSSWLKPLISSALPQNGKKISLI